MTEKYRCTWRPPPTFDDYMYEVQVNIWWDRKDRAKHQLLWLMETFLGDGNEKATFSKISSNIEEEEGEDGDYYVVGRRGAD